MAGNINVNGQVNLKVNFQTEQAVQQMQKLTQELNKVSSLGHQVGASLYENIYGKDGKTLLHNGDLIKNQIQAASKSAMELQSHLITAFNPKNGNLDLMKFTNSLKVSGKDLNAYSESLMQLGSQGKQSYMGLARAVASAEMPLKRTTTMMDKAWGGLKKTAGWMISSSILHGFVGNIQQAMGYAQDLNKSLTDIRIVTNASSSDMARFAKQANIAAKELNTTTTRYTKASLIYYQQGLNDQQVKERTETTIKMANVTGETAQKVSDQMTAIWNNYDNGTKSLTHYADVMTALGAATASSTTEIAEGLQKFASISNTVGLSYEYAASALATITATSRESADVTGNSLKTLFSRIQGLQLGETLDDGTTLNKYSTALAKVGISIKDSSGELKSMDNILDEMGSTWQTLANDEKMALAQTVAGVRQYTQLMTLMENWDDFKKNLNVANNSEGTIDQQSAIFAESWEAASNRVRASWEGLWDSLIDSDGFISLQNGLSAILNFFELMVDGAGGLTGTLTMLGGLFGKMFTPQIASAATSMINGIQQLNPKTASAAIKGRESFLNTISNTVNSGSGALMGMGAWEGRAFKQQITALANNSADRARYLPLMNEQQRAYDNILSEQMRTIYDKQIQYGRQKDILDQSIGSQAKQGFVALTKEEAQQYEDIKTGISKEQGIIKNIEDKAKLSYGRLNPEDEKKKSSAEERLIKLTQQKEDFDKRGVFTSLKYTPDKSVISSDQLDQLQLTANKGAGIYSHLNNAFWQNAQSVDGKNLPNYTGMQEAFTKALENQGWSSDQIKNSPLIKAMSNIINAEPGKEGSWAQNADLIRKEMKSVAMGSLNSEIDKMITEGKLNEDSATRLKSVSGKMFDSALMGELIGSNDTDLEATKEARRQLYTQAQKAEKMQSAVGITQGLSFAVSAAESIKSLNAAIGELASGAGDASKVLTSATSALTSGAIGFSSLSNSLTTLLPEMLKGSAGKISLGIMGVIAAIDLGIEAWDYFTTNIQEVQAGLLKSTEELSNNAETSAQAAELATSNNEKYLDGVKKIKSFSQDPSTLMEDIYQSNKMALQLIQDYNLASDEYITNSQGLIEISEDKLEEKAQEKANTATIADMSNVIGNAANAQISADKNLTQFQQNYMLTEAGKNINEILSANGLAGSVPVQDMIQAYKKGGEDWENFKNQYDKYSSIKGGPDWTIVEQAIIDNALSLEDKKTQSDLQLANAARVSAGMVLNQQGITPANQEGYLAIQEAVREQIQDQIQEQFVPLEGTKLTSEVKSKLPGLLAEYGQQGAHGFKLRDGVLSYRLDGEASDRTIQAATINAIYNSSKILEKSAEYISTAQNDLKTTGDEASFFIKKFGTVTGASANSIKKLYGKGKDSDKEAFKQKYQDSGQYETEEKAEKAAEDDWLKIDKILGDEGIDKKLGLDEQISSNVAIDALETLQKVMEVDDSSAKGLESLFEGIQTMTGDNDPEKAAQLLTALSNMDFSENAYLNATNLLGVLEDLGYNVNEGSLPLIYAWLCDITGLSPGSENLAETNKSISEKRGALNGIEPGSKVDTDAKKDAEDAKKDAEDAGLRGNWVKSGEDEYTYTGTQDQIDAAKSFQNEAWAKNQMAIDAAQANKDKIANSGLKGDYDSITALANDLGIGYNKYSGQYVGGNENVDLVEDVLGLNPGTLLNMINSDPQAVKDMVNNMVNNSGISDETQAAGAEDFMTNIDSAEDLSNAIAESKQRDDTAGFTENGLLSDATVNRMKTLTDTSLQYQEAMEHMADVQDSAKSGAEQYATAQKELQQMQEDGIVNTEREAELKEIMEQNQGDYDIYSEAQGQAELALAIESVSNARGLDADLVARYAQELEPMVKNQELSAQTAAKMAADLAAQAEGLQECAEHGAKWVSTLVNGTKGSQKYEDALSNLSKSLSKVLKIEDQVAAGALKMGKAFEQWAKQNPGKVAKAMQGDLEAGAEAMEQIAKDTYDGKAATKQGAKAWQDFSSTTLDSLSDIWKGLEANNLSEAGTDISTAMANAEGEMSAAAQSAAANAATFVEAFATAAQASGMSAADFQAGLSGFGFELEPIDATVAGEVMSSGGGVLAVPNEVGYEAIPQPPVDNEVVTDGSVQYYKIVSNGGPGGGGGGSGGGGGGGGKKPKKVANKRKSQTVKRYKRNDFKRDAAERAKKSAEQNKDYLYGESKIAQMEKMNRLAEKEAKITSDRIKESQRYLEEDRQNLIRYMRKYGFEAEFDADGFLSNYEETWTKLYEELAALYEDNELTEEEEELEEEINIKLEELEGALEDYENSLKELQDDIEAYEESLYEMYDNKVEALKHKVEFKIELEEDDMAFLDFWIESLGDSLYNALEAIEAMGAKANHLFDGLEVYKQGIEDIYALSDDPFQAWVTGSLNTDILTQDQVDMLRDNRDGLIDYAQQLVDLREEIKDKVIDTFDLWTERIDASRASLEHYTAVIEHFKNIIDIVGQDSLGLNDAFMDKLEQSAINQSMDHIESNRAYYESLVEQQAKAQEELDAARARGDKSSEEHWEEVVRTTTEAMETAQDELLTSLEDTLTLIAEQFETSMQRAVDAFNDAIYSYGGLEGLSSDYSMAKEYSSLMAQDYQKIYELNKINRNINKTLSDSNIIAGKQKMVELQKEINALQASNVELSQYDLEYLQAKYELRLAEIELENARNNKDTVRLSKDSEGNWSYVYTQNMDAIDEAQQKYEDALYNMQNLSYEYMEEMSSAMVDTSISMMEELQNLRIQDFDSYEEYAKEVQRIQDKYGDYLSNQENELNKSVSNNKDLYNQDWQNYSEMTGYKISESQLWADNFSESTLGVLMNSDSMISDFANNILSLSDIMINSLGSSALQYFGNVETVLNKYGTSIAGFGATVNSTVTTMSTKSKSTSEDIKSMAQDMKDAFIEIADVVSDWQEEFSQKIDDMLTQISLLIQEINEAIRKSAELTSPSAPNDLIGTTEAIELLNKAAPEGYDLGEFSQGQNGQIIANGTTYQNWLDYNASLIEEIDKKIAEMANEHTGTERRKQLEEELAILFVKYHAFKDIVGRIYDVASGSTVQLETPAYSSFDTGGYTGEWGDSGKLAMLHEKELILNKQDTENFLNALNISRDLINSMIEMNARASSMGFGNLAPTSFQENSQTLEQQVTITAEFPNATNHDEIEEAFNNLINTASQYANRYNL